MAKPLLLVDVDGVISLFGFDPHRPPPGSWLMVDGIAHWISAGASARLHRLAGTYELAWCTGWEEKANEYLVHELGLGGPLPFLSFDRAVGRANAHWKLDAIDAFAGPDRSLAWLDDAHNLDCDTWALERGAPTLLAGCEPAVGLTDEHVVRLLDWAASRRAAQLPCERPTD